MAAMAARLREDPALADAYAAAHEAYLAARRAIGALTGDGDVPEIAGVSAGGMPDRVKCLHALAAHALAAGPGVNPLGDETLALVGPWWERPCLPSPAEPVRGTRRGPSGRGPMTNTVAAFDCGTNSLRLLLAGPGTGGPDGTALTDLDRQTEIVRLGQGVDATGEFAPEALERTFAVTRRFAELVRAAGVPAGRTRFVATSASRDARNRDEFFAGIEELVGVRPDVISGDEEARLSFAGALSRIRPTAEPVLVMDVGGGSTELIVGDAAGEVGLGDLARHRLRTPDRTLPRRRPARRRRADRRPRARRRPARLLRRRLRRRGHLGRRGRHGHHPRRGPPAARDVRPRARVARLDDPACPSSTSSRPCCRRMDVDQIKALPSMHPGRADVVTAGALIATRVAARLHVDRPDRQRVRHPRRHRPPAAAGDRRLSPHAARARRSRSAPRSRPAS